MTYQEAIRPDYVLARRRRLARIILAVHLTAVLILFMFLAGTEGPAAQGTPQSVTLAKARLFLIAVAALAELILTARWAQHALTRRRIQAPRPNADLQTPWQRSAAMQSRTERGAIPCHDGDDRRRRLAGTAQAQALALRWIRFSIGLAALIVLLFVLTAATGKLDAHIGFVAPVLLLLNLSWAARWKKVLDKTRRAETSIRPGRGPDANSHPARSR
jgi:hypothetical protein